MDVITINISMPEEFLEKVDKAAKTLYMGRSELIREALRTYIDSKVPVEGGDE